jgi:hypothetical protein
VSKTYQKTADSASAEVIVPAKLTISLDEVVESAKEGLLALAVGTGLKVMEAMFAADTERLCGPKNKHNAKRAGYRHGSEGGAVTLGGRRLPVSRPRVRASDGSEELSVPSYALFSSTEVLGRLAMERMLAGLSTRRYRVGLEPVGQKITGAANGTSRSAVSRRFIVTTESALADLLARPLDDLDLVALMIDGVHFAKALLCRRPGHRCQGRQTSPGAGRGVHGERHLGNRPLGGLARARAGCEPPAACRDRRRQGVAPRRHGRLRLPADPALPAAQDQERQRQGCPRSCAAWSSGACAPPTAPRPLSRPKRS